MEGGQRLLNLLQGTGARACPSETPSESQGSLLLKMIQSPVRPPPSALTRLSLPGADVRYMQAFLSDEEAWGLFDELNRHKQTRRDHWTRMNSTGREIAQWSEPGGRKYVFSDTEYVARKFPAFVHSLKRRIEKRLQIVEGREFNYCVANFYIDQNCGVSWHSDSEAELVDEAPIVCVSVGAQRTLGLRHKRSLEETHISLHHGSLFVMAGLTQMHYLHSILKESNEPTINQLPRFSLTFRLHHSPVL